MVCGFVISAALFIVILVTLSLGLLSYFVWQSVERGSSLLALHSVDTPKPRAVGAVAYLQLGNLVFKYVCIMRLPPPLALHLHLVKSHRLLLWLSILARFIIYTVPATSLFIPFTVAPLSQSTNSSITARPLFFL